MVFQKDGRLAENLKIYYEKSEIELVNTFVYLGIVFIKRDCSDEQISM